MGAVILHFITLSIIIVMTGFVLDGHSQCLESDREALMEFKFGLKDPVNRLSSWQGNNCCQWYGIGCDNITGAVTILDLHNSDGNESWSLSGEIRPALTNLKSLRHLDLSFNAFTDLPIPKFFGSLEKLQYLNLANAGFGGTVPPSMGNNSALQYLDISSDFLNLAADSIEWVTGLTSLRYLSLNGVDLSSVGSSWVGALNMLPYLTDLHLSSCNLFGSIASLEFVNFSSLAVLDLHDNNFKSKFPSWLVNISSLVYVDVSDGYLVGSLPLGFSEFPNLQVFNLSGNLLAANIHELFHGSWRKMERFRFNFNLFHGKLPDSIGNLTSLTELDLLENIIEGEIPVSIGGLCNLEFLRLSYNNLTGSLPEILQGTENCPSKTPFPSLQYLMLDYNQLVGKLPYWLGQLRNLVELNLEFNKFIGSIPASLGALSHLTTLTLYNNELNGTLPDSLGQLSELSVLDVSFNHMSGIISEVHFLQQRKLEVLNFASNSFIFNVSSSWVPPFQLFDIEVGSCYFGSSFPEWLRSQRNIESLDFSNCSISGPIPSWFWDNIDGLRLLNFSCNQLQGQLPSLFEVMALAYVDLSSNLFEGPIPIPTFLLQILNLSNNLFSGSIPESIGELTQITTFFSLADNKLVGEIPASIGHWFAVGVIDFSRNNLSGSIPATIGNCFGLEILDVQNNKISGEIPTSLGQLRFLQLLHLSDNMISGEFPMSLQNMSSLRTLDLGNNRMTGNIPPWIGSHLPDLQIIRLRSNAFSGELPPTLSNLSVLQVLDLAENELIGTIPANFGNFKAMIQPQNIFYMVYGGNGGGYYEESIVVNIKGNTRKYTRTLYLLTCIDLSGNYLRGEFPQEITKLAGLVVMNLSRNHISGKIPESISELQQLDSLDLSSNVLSGPIPPTMSSLSFLGYLNLSANNLSGRIPYEGHMTTFDASSFANNLGLCGPPLVVRCSGDNPTETRTNENGSENDNWFFLAICLGFAAGILVPFVILATNRTLSTAYFTLADKAAHRLLYLYHRIRLAASSRSLFQ